MGSLDERLAAWTEAGLIREDQAEAIAEYEDPDTTVTSVTGSRKARRSSTSTAEAIGYVGAALALGAVALILGDLWQELLAGGRLALVATLTAALFGAGLGVRSSTPPAMRRLTSVLFASSVAGVGWFAAVVESDVLALRDTRMVLSAGLAMVVVATPLYFWQRRALLQLAVLGSVLLSVGAALDQAAITPGPGWFGLVIATVGAAWAVMAVGRWLEPRVVGEVAGTFVTFVGVQTASFGGSRAAALIAGVVIAGALVAFAVRSDELHHLVIGAIALFVFSPQLVFEVFGDAVGAPAMLLLMGLLLVLLAVGLGRARREVGRTPARPEGGRP